MIMAKRIVCTFLFLFLLGLPTAAFAADKPNVEVAILSPDQVKDYPGIETKVTAKVTNRSNQPIEDMMVYITMADTVKHWTVNLEDYSADKPVTIGTLQPNETKEVSLPIRFVYVSNYHLYVTAAGTKDPWIYSSSSIPVEIMGNTKIDPAIVRAVSIAEPAVLLAGVLVFYIWKKRRRY